VATYLGEIARMAPEYFCLCELVKFRNFGGSSEGPVFCHTPRCMISGMSAVLTRPIAPSLGMSFSVFAQLSESVAVAARHVGLVPPGFQSLSTGISRRLVRRTPAGPIIAVKVRGRSTGSVLIDLVEGVLAVAPDSGEANARLAQEMYAFLGAEGWPIVEDRETEPNSNVVGVQAA
jgi:hypothetical protein